MTSISIQTQADEATIEALKALLFKIDPTAVFQRDDECDISKADALKLKDIVRKLDSNELKLYEFDEMRERSKNHLKKLGANI
ncbi:hypothetical protein [Campylobacter mucosalis]|uniref:hypothetical protein n=1 Tax=Campylobacter mucosalis TaxID=202 RepID=UPI0004D9300D|nr:hypothetical protein [Campylobacter mucosalis]KEA46225.1 hypothetical protein CR66_03225 [Campylobacter mucosalis]QKF62683.1 hypothetical protein CMCT_0523 [Campylobacter mucosalis]